MIHVIHNIKEVVLFVINQHYPADAKVHPALFVGLHERVGSLLNSIMRELKLHSLFT